MTSIRITIISIILIILTSFVINNNAEAGVFAISSHNADSCIAFVHQKKTDTINDFSQLHTTEYLIKNNTLDTVYIKSITCQASDQMPIYKHKYLLPGQMDTLKIVSNFKYLKTYNSAGTKQIRRTSIIETDNCKQTLEMIFYVNITEVENIRTNKTIYKTNDSLVIISNGYFSADGSCIPKLYWGLEKPEDNIWKQAFDLKAKPKMCCGPGSYRFVNQNDSIAIFSLKKVLNYFTLFEKGTYRVYTLNEDHQLVYSNVFTHE